VSHIPYRTGITSIKLLLRRVCNILVAFKPVMYAVLPTEQHVYIDALEQACNDFILQVSNPRPGDE